MKTPQNTHTHTHTRWRYGSQGYEGHVLLVVEEVCDGDGTVADPRAQEHEQAHPGLHLAALVWEGGRGDITEEYTLIHTLQHKDMAMLINRGDPPPLQPPQ